MPNIRSELMDAASELKEAFARLGLMDRVMTMNNIVSRAKRNAEMEGVIGTDAVEKAGNAVRTISGRLRDVMTRRRICNSDILSVMEDSEEDISVIRENGDRCPDFVSVPAGMLMSGISRVMRRMAGGGPSDGLRSDSACILRRALEGVAKYDDEE